MKRPIRISEPASDEFSEAVRWYEARRAGLGSEFFDAVAASITLVETNPDIGTTISTSGQTRRVLVSRFPYQVVYRPTPTRDSNRGNRPSEAAPGVLEKPQLSFESPKGLR